MTLTITRDYEGRLLRDGIRWPAMVAEAWPYLHPIDELFPGDRLELPETVGGQLLLSVALRQPQYFRDRYSHLDTHDYGDGSRYVLDACVSCPACGQRATHSITVLRPDDDRCGRILPFGRECASCGTRWEQNGSTTQGRRGRRR